MKAVGVVVEYNPFHNGHLYHLRESKKLSNADVTIAVMSGYFLQRGEPAFVSKWARTKMALDSGIDLVVELPYAFATQKAETFANGAVSILEALGCNYLCFGSEDGTIDSFINAANLVLKENERYDELIKQYIQTGVNYPTAITRAFQNLIKNDKVVDLSQPNNILGYHYVKAMLIQKTKMKPLTIVRTAAGYHEENFVSPSIASATSIRKAILTNSHDISRYVPVETKRVLDEYFHANQLYHHWEHYFDYLKYALMTMSGDELRTVYEMEEGLEHRLSKFIRTSHSFQEFMENVKTKRYTWTRLQRLCLHILTRTTKQNMENMTPLEKSPYIRLLGMSLKGQEYLRTIKKQLDIPLISKVSDGLHPILDLDLKAATIFHMIFSEPLRSELLKREYNTPPIRG
ncbi:nucleotidyltransferase [Metabacillus malikii]|uniref:tRNA(Met) cytidine acetate ligase n=1 Tax=Metabacillus malikii TaxID=1504265 RepID=A0ABT9ZG92_9BACI|nr:nucleotidyltransferase [Metabacillus malikii]MDQ0231287.1 putative nucleotidyltransferase [Metabacillus malikii]